MSAFGHGTEIRANFLQTSMYDDLQQFALLGTKNEAPVAVDVITDIARGASC